MSAIFGKMRVCIRCHTNGLFPRWVHSGREHGTTRARLATNKMEQQKYIHYFHAIFCWFIANNFDRFARCQRLLTNSQLSQHYASYIAHI